MKWCRDKVRLSDRVGTITASWWH